MGRAVRLLGPAFVASVAYVDPGNVAANLTAGSRYGYALVWVLVLSSVMAMVVQYQSAKLGVVTGASLSALVVRRLEQVPGGRVWRWLYALQAMAMAIATDVAEVIGGALALQLLFGLPLWLGGLVVGATTLALLELVRRHGERIFELAVTAVLAVVAVGFLAGLLWTPPSPGAALRGLLPDFPDAAALPMAGAMLGATVMPHAIYLHATMAADRHRPDGRPPEGGVAPLLRVQRWDVLLALLVAGSVNVAMLLFAAAALGRRGRATDSIAVAFQAIATEVGALPAVVFALGLLVAGVGSALVGTHAGARILRDLVSAHIPVNLRRALTVGPAVVLLWFHHDATRLLVDSQLVLSFGIVFALVPLVGFTGSRRTMGRHRDSLPLRVASVAVVVAIVALNLALLFQALR